MKPITALIFHLDGCELCEASAKYRATDVRAQLLINLGRPRMCQIGNSLLDDVQDAHAADPIVQCGRCGEDHDGEPCPGAT